MFANFLMLNWIQVWALAGPLKDIHRFVLKPLLWYLGCVLKVVVLLKDEPSPQSEVKRALEQVFIQDVSVHCCIHVSLYPDYSPSSCRWKTSPQHDAATTMLHCRDGIGLVMSSAWFPLNMMPAIHANLCLIRPDHFVSHGLRILRVHFGKLQASCHVPFTKEWLLSGHSTIQAWLVDCCRDVFPGRFSSLHRGTLELW